MTKVYQATGKRKTSVAKVKLTSGSGKIIVNGVDVREYFPFETLVMDLEQPLVLTNTKELFDIEIITYEDNSKIIIDLSNYYGYLVNIELRD